MAIASRQLSLVSGADAAEESSYAEACLIAFATTDNEHVNQHFGSAQQFAIYEVSSAHWKLISMAEFPIGPEGHDNNKLQIRMQALSSCAAIYCNAIGASAVRQLLAKKIKPINMTFGTSIKGILQELIQAWQKNPAHWLQKSVQAKANTGAENEAQAMRLNELLNEEWEL